MKLDRNKVVFLLGGKDLEMEEIKSVLDSKKLKYLNNTLSWDDATLRQYEKQLNTDTTYYAIELNIDDTNAIDKKLLSTYDIRIIDHHGDKHNHKEASLLQILKLLEEIPTPRQKLIAVNDARYIEGMLCLGATDKEIKDIRDADRESQGVVLHDDTTAKIDVKQRIVKKDISIVYAHTPHFSAITDSLYFNFIKEERTNQSIVYNDDKIVFYGFESSYIKDVCKKFDIKKEQYYYGGGDSGYFGIKDKVINIKRMEEMIKHAVENRPLHSSHIFMFPFRFDYANKSIVNDKGYIHEYAFYYNNDIGNRINLDGIEKKLKKENWHYEKYSTHNDLEEMHLAYNEFAYFYDYAKDSLYNRDNFNEDAISSFFRKGRVVKDEEGKEKIVDFYKDEIYKIEVLNTQEGKVINPPTTYELEIQGVTLRIFHTGIAILSIELENYKHKEFKDILRINDYGRRVYPQYIGDDKEDRTYATKKSFLPNSISIGSDNVEDFNAFEYEDIEIGKHIMQVLGTGLFADKKSLTKDNATYDKFYIQPSLDDRMFVMSSYVNKELSEELTNCYSYKESDAWYEYVFADGNGATVKNSMMKKELLKQATYDRWSNWGTIFGVTRYSFMAVISPQATYVVKHMNTMYFQMATLLLANRTSILRFSDEIAALVSPPQKLDIEKHTDKLEKLYDIYLKYYNRLYFKEVTHQDQGIELYDIGIKQMRIGSHVDKLDGKFEKLFNFMNLKAEKKQSSRMDKLTIWGAVLLIPSFVISLFDLDEVKAFFTEPHIVWVGLSTIVGYMIALAITSKGEK